VAQTFLSVLIQENTMNDPTVHIKRRNLPHWTLEVSTYFVTFRVATGTLSIEERAIVRDHLQAGHGKFYQLAAAVIMPDHVHLLLRPIGDYTLSRVMKGIKGVSAHLLNQRRGTRGQIWQDESWDRIIRDDAEFEEKLTYMANNPVKAGLVDPDEPYDGWLINSDWC
jgi:REP element-mobilizing transposase RayT